MSKDATRSASPALSSLSTFKQPSHPPEEMKESQDELHCIFNLPTQSWNASLTAVARVEPLTTDLSFFLIVSTWELERESNWREEQAKVENKTNERRRWGCIFFCVKMLTVWLMLEYNYLSCCRARYKCDTEFIQLWTSNIELVILLFVVWVICIGMHQIELFQLEYRCVNLLLCVTVWCPMNLDQVYKLCPEMLLLWK